MYGSIYLNIYILLLQMQNKKKQLACHDKTNQQDRWDQDRVLHRRQQRSNYLHCPIAFNWQQHSTQHTHIYILLTLQHSIVRVPANGLLHPANNNSCRCQRLLRSASALCYVISLN